MPGNSAPEMRIDDDDEQRLLKYLFTNYNPQLRPVENKSDRVTVTFGISLHQIINVVGFLYFTNFFRRTVDNKSEISTLQTSTFIYTLTLTSCLPESYFQRVPRRFFAMKFQKSCKWRQRCRKVVHFCCINIQLSC